MRIVRTLARPMLAGVFITGGLDTFRTPEPRAEQAAPVIDRMAEAVPSLPLDRATLVQLNGTTHVVAGSMLGLGIFPRLAALALAGTLVPTTLGGHRFWEITDDAKRRQQQTHFMKNLAIMGGLLVVALD